MAQESDVPEQGVPWRAWFSIGIMAYRLYRRHRWAFIVYVLFCAANVVAMLGNPIVMLVNLALGLVLLTAYPHFFPGNE